MAGSFLSVNVPLVSNTLDGGGRFVVAPAAGPVLVEAVFLSVADLRAHPGVQDQYRTSRDVQGVPVGLGRYLLPRSVDDLDLNRVHPHQQGAV